MQDLKEKNLRRLRRKRHIRKRIFGTATKPRLTVFRSHRNIACQLIDDARGVTLASASTASKDLRGQAGPVAGKKGASMLVGKRIAEKAIQLGVKSIAFDRNGYRFHGRIKALADAAREAGLVF